MLKKYKVGIIGAGAIVELSHIPVLKNLEEIEIAWQYDKSVERSAVITKMFQVPALKEEELDSAIQQIDICLLTVPYGARKYFIEKCASKNKSLYVEKPFATKSDEHINYCSLFPAYKLAVGFQRRYYKIVYDLQKIIGSRIFGSFSIKTKVINRVMKYRPLIEIYILTKFPKASIALKGKYRTGEMANAANAGKTYGKLICYVVRKKYNQCLSYL